VFAVQDEVARAIVAILPAHVNKAEVERTLLKPPTTWQAYDNYMRGCDAFASYLSLYRVKDLYEARRYLERSLSIDADYARAYAALSRTHMTAWVNASNADHLNSAALDRAYELASKALQLDSNLPQAHADLGYVLTYKRQHEASLARFERAIGLNPNFTEWRFALALVYAGEPARAIEVVKAHMRHDPFYPPAAPGFLGFAHYMLKDYAEALAPLNDCVSRAPNMRSGHTWLAATCAQLGELEEARREAVEVLRIEPRWTIDGTARHLAVFKHPRDAEHWFDGLRKAGLPER
jgi:adenylate cyclase